MTYLKDNRTVRFEEIESDRLREESDLEENSPGIENPPTAKFFSSATRYHSDAMLHFEAGKHLKSRAQIDFAHQQELINEIIEVTSAIREAFAEFYQLLSETPLFIARQDKAISSANFEQYLESLKTQLAVFKENHDKVRNLI